MWLLLTCVVALFPDSGEHIATRQDIELNLLVSNIREGHGALLIAAYDCAENFLTDRAIYTTRISVTDTGKLVIQIPNLATGMYAISIFHDVNDNGKLDKNFLGIPTEPVGFSNNARRRFGPPKFSDAKFNVGIQQQTMEITLYGSRKDR